MWTDASSCKGTIPVSVLALHGTADDTIKYDGGELLGMKYTSALATAKAWAATDGCDAQPDESALPIDVDAKIAGAETTISRWTKGCKANTGVELWTMKDSPHIPLPLADDFASRVTDFLFAHAKP
jgi:polyhydroxybutyrate depolymerase